MRSPGATSSSKGKTIDADPARDAAGTIASPSIFASSFICRGAAAGDVIEMVKHLDQCSFAAAVETLIGEFRPIVTRATPTPAKPETDEEYEREQHHKAAWLWQHRQPIGGMIAEIYLRS